MDGEAIGGIVITGVLATSFITLKLLNVINWSWWWVLSPLWIPVVITLLLTFIFIIFN